MLRSDGISKPLAVDKVQAQKASYWTFFPLEEIERIKMAKNGKEIEHLCEHVQKMCCVIANKMK